MADPTSLAPLTTQAVQGATNAPPQPDEDELFRRLLNGDASVQLVNPKSTTAMGGTNVPDVRNMPSVLAGQVVGEQTMAAAKFRQSAERPGVELDTEEGAPAWLRFAAGFHREREDQLAFWRQKYGQDKVDVVDGKFVLRDVPDDKGKLRDVLVDEEKLTGKDVLDTLGDAPELILSVLAARRMAARNAGLVAQSLAASLTFSGTGAAKDVAMRQSIDQPVRPAEIAAARGVEASTDLLFSAIPPSLRGVINMGRRPFGVAPGILPLEGIEGQRFIREQTGIEIPLSLAERTGSQPFARAEAYVERIPVARRPVQRTKEDKIAKIREVQTFLMEGTPPSSTEVGERAVGAIRKEIEPTVKGVENAASTAERSAAMEVHRPLSQRVGASMSPLELGDTIAKRAQEKLASVREESKKLYDAVYEIPEARQDVFDLAPVAAKAREILKKLPSVPEQPKTVESALVDQFGKAQTVTIPGRPDARDPISELIKSELLGRMESLAQRGDQKTRLFDLVQMRDRIWDLAGSGAITDMPTKDLKSLSAAITEAIEGGVDKVGGPLRQKLHEANKYYRENMPKFEQPGVVDLLSQEPGVAARRESIVASIFSSGKGSAGRYRQLKELLGDDDEAIKNVRQYFLDNIAEKAVDPVTRTVDFKDVLNSMQKLNPDIKKDLFGSGAFNIEDAARLGLVAQGKVDYDAVKNLIQSNQLTRRNVQALITEQRNLDDLMRNQIKKAVKEGSIDSSTINPDEFVNRYILNTEIPAKDVREAMRVMQSSDDPTLVRDIRRKTLEDIFRKAQKTGVADGVGGEDITRRVQGDVTREIDPQKLSLVFDKRENVERLREVLSPMQFDLISALVKVGGASAKSQALAGAAGAFASGSLLKDMVTSLTGSADVAKFYVLGWMLTDDRVIRTLTKARDPLEMKKTMQALILTPEFSRALVDDYPNDLERANLLKDIRQTFAERPGATITGMP